MSLKLSWLIVGDQTTNRQLTLHSGEFDRHGYLSGIMVNVYSAFGACLRVGTKSQDILEYPFKQRSSKWAFIILPHIFS